MQVANTESWKISLGDPQLLQFVAYIGSQEGFDPLESGQPQTEAETQWKEWWLAFPEMEAERMTHFQTLVKNLVASTPRKAFTSNFGFDPPDFSSVQEDRKALRELFIKYWPQFQVWYAKERNKFRGGGIKLPERLGLHQLIKEIEQTNGRTAKPFELKIDFVYWPENYLRFVSDNFVVITSPDGIAERETALKELLRSLIGKLA
jgi:hypothetical protein